MSEIVIYEDGSVAINATVDKESVWLSQKQIADLFGVQRPAVTKHLSNIFKSGELDEEVVCSILEQTTQHGAIKSKKQTTKTKLYNLDAIISIGYRVNSKRATQFRIWATGVLKQYIIDGYVLDQKRLQQQKLTELEQTIQLIKQGLQNSQLSTDEAKGFVEIIGNYARSWALLQGYDDQSLQEVIEHTEEKFVLDYDEAKAANLLYYIIKGHPFNDGNKRIGAYLFVLFLHKNGILHKPNGEPRINDNALASVALLVAQSDPAHKEILIRLIMNMLYDPEE